MDMSKFSVKRMINFFLASFVGVIIFTSCNQVKQKETTGASKPNIIFIVADDLGFSDIGPFGGNIPVSYTHLYFYPGSVRTFS